MQCRGEESVAEHLNADWTRGHVRRASTCTIGVESHGVHVPGTCSRSLRGLTCLAGLLPPSCGGFSTKRHFLVRVGLLSIVCSVCCAAFLQCPTPPPPLSARSILRYGAAALLGRAPLVLVRLRRHSNRGWWKMSACSTSPSWWFNLGALVVLLRRCVV